MLDNDYQCFKLWLQRGPWYFRVAIVVRLLRSLEPRQFDIVDLRSQLLLQIFILINLVNYHID